MHVLVQMAKDIVSGMEHLRANDVVHRDLAARNLLLEIRSNGEHRVKVGLRTTPVAALLMFIEHISIC